MRTFNVTATLYSASVKPFAQRARSSAVPVRYGFSAAAVFASASTAPWATSFLVAFQPWL